MGYALYTFLVTLVQVMLCIGALSVLQKEFHMTIGTGLLCVIFITVMSTVYALVICYNGKSEVQVNITASSISAILTLLGGTFVAIEAMPGLLQILSHASPIRWVVELIRIL